MSDPRDTPANSRVAAAHLGAAPAGLARVDGVDRCTLPPVTDLLRAPDGPRNRQLLRGDRVRVFEDRNGWSFVQAHKDCYVGYLPSAALGPDTAVTHWVSAPATHVYAAPDIKSPDRLSLSFGSRVIALSETGGFIEISDGFVPAVHLSPIDTRLDDPVTVAALFLGTPYLWGGNSRSGIDCSGLVQAAMLACGLPCPGDSDQQQVALGRVVPANSAPQRGDLLFWKGHVALVCDPDTIIHAIAHHMAVAFEAIEPARERIITQGDGEMTGHKRLEANPWR